MTSGSRSANSSSAVFDWQLTVNTAMEKVVASLADAPFAPGIEAIDNCRNELAAVEALLIARRTQQGHSSRSTEGIIKQSGAISKNEAKKRTSRAAAINTNPTLAKKLTTGDISTEQLDNLAEAADKTGGDAAKDTKLITKLSSANPDVGKAIVREYVEEHKSQGDRDAKHRWQRERRKVYKGQTRSGMAYLMIEGDDHTVDGMLRSLKRRANAMYQSDGGRDVPSAKHDRTIDQRLFDAAAEKLAGAGPVDQEPPCSTRSSTPTQQRRRSSERPTAVLSGKLSEVSDDPELVAQWKAELIGTGIVPTAVASYYRCISDFAGMLLDEDGSVLWKGRSVRLATPEQWTALVIRDRGCVRCAAHVDVCDAHHVIPSGAPAKGETNIDNLVLLCSDCHHWVHETDKTMFWNPATGTWQYRNARWEERSPKRRPEQRPPPRGTDRIVSSHPLRE